MRIKFPGIEQTDLDYAVGCLNNCMQSDASEFGFNYPYFTPGGSYGKQWWQLDSSLALSGYKWIDRKFAETSLLNFIESQKHDGRICLWGYDVLPKKVAGDNFPLQSEGVSSLPKIFDVTYHILQGSSDNELIKKSYVMMKRYIDWWYSERYDKDTGLITAVFEETFIPYLGYAKEYAAVDTNVEVYVGLIYTASIAEKLKIDNEAYELRKKAESLKSAINKYLWNNDKGCYFPYDILKGKSINCLMASTFNPFRMNIAPKEHQSKMLETLINNDYFNWNLIPVTSVSKQDKIFKTTKGVYQGNDSWSGNVWTLINEIIIRGLLDIGENKLAAELALKTIYAFNNNCFEFINPFDGSGHGVEKYAWTASQYLELIIEVIFGISFNFKDNEVIITPNLTEDLKKENISIEGIMLTDDTQLDVFINNGKVSYNLTSNNNIKVKIM